jgi:hypothetical protein
MKIYFIVAGIFSLIQLHSQINKRITLGMTFNTERLQTNYGINFGMEYNHNYSQINLLNGTFVATEIFSLWKLDEGLSKHFGFGYTHRYFPDKKKSLFTSFFEGGVSLVRYSEKNMSQLYDSLSHMIIPYRILRNITNIYIGYGIGLNLLHRITISTSVGEGFFFVNGENIYTIGGDFSESYRDHEHGLLINFSVLYHFSKF